VNESGYREILGICEGAKEDKAGWSAFLKHLKERGLRGVRLIISDACLGLAESAAEFFPEAAWQRCIVGSLKKLTAACSKPGRVCAFPKRHRHFIFEGDYACIRLRQAMHRANSARKAAASRFRLMAAAVR
jgi:hypothetical protein